MKVKVLFLNFRRDLLDFNVFFSYFGHIGATEFPETSYVKSLAPSEDSVLQF